MRGVKGVVQQEGCTPPALHTMQSKVSLALPLARTLWALMAPPPTEENSTTFTAATLTANYAGTASCMNTTVSISILPLHILPAF